MHNLMLGSAASIQDRVEGTAERRELEEPRTPLQTTTVPVVDSEIHRAHKAETGVVALVASDHAEGQDKNEGQDASRTTEENETSPEPQAAKETDSERTPSVLILEDTMELAEVIQATLERMNMVTAHETHGTKALVKFKEFKPDVVLLDINLPDMTGWKFLETIKELPAAQMPAVIVISAYGDPANRLVGKLQGVYDYLIKPFTADEVEKVVTNALKPGAMTTTTPLSSS
ncbi:MAG: response regulator [Anaerolineaceae bacterium]|nr:response regulator [Anaerolineaceae bacterium]